MANDENVRNAYAGIIGLLPADWQRLVNDQLPHLEELINQEVEQFGRDLAEHLVNGAKKSACDGEANVDRADRAMESVLKELENSRRLADEGLAAIESVNAKLAALGVAGASDVASRGIWHANALRGLLDRLRDDFAADRVEGLDGYRLSLGQWRELVDADLIADCDLDSLIDVASPDQAAGLSLPHRPSLVPLSSTLEDEHERVEVLRQQITDAFDAPSADDRLYSARADDLSRIQESHAELAGRLKEIANEVLHTESVLEEYEAERREVVQKRHQLLREVGNRTEEVTSKIVANALDLQAEDLQAANEQVKGARRSHQTAGDARRCAAAKVEEARRSLAGCRRDLAAGVEAVRAGAQAARLPIMAGD